ncbi:hypothetical protein GCK72_020137 [Caenorhabditis remanei]|uniref:Serpentine Receptor, class H n=1 Tax=Caenorhabditis remanei TaxID=31234 RepID=A0A6A5GEP8_CAERE|nr:hypothetical protein GCK72_020137 [Caenorhabditis remanei]KAF1753580.1 hypothetical protein GCK72_020137 [Caenorhabditis remanei]
MSSVRIYLLNLHCWCVALDLVISFFGIPYLIYPAIAGYGLGFIESPGLFFYLGVTFIAGTSTSMFVLFENRYFTIFGQTSYWKYFRKYVVVVSYILVPLYFLPPQLYIPEQTKAREVALASLPCIPELPSDNRQLFVQATELTLIAVSIVIGEGVPTIQCGTFFFLNCFYLVLAKKPSGLSKKTVHMQHKLVIALIIQSSITIVLFLVPVNSVILFVFFQHQNQFHNNFIVFALAIHGISSTIIMVLAHKPYRDFAMYPLSCFIKKPKKVSVMPSVPSFRSTLEF